MALVDVIQQVKADLRAGRFANEAAISQSVVLPILQSLGWPVLTRPSWLPNLTYTFLAGVTLDAKITRCFVRMVGR